MGNPGKRNCFPTQTPDGVYGAFCNPPTLSVFEINSGQTFEFYIRGNPPDFGYFPVVLGPKSR